MRRMINLRTIFFTTTLGLATTIVPIAFGQGEFPPGQVETQNSVDGNGESAPGQENPAQAGSIEAAISDTTLTWRRHQIAAGTSAGSLEGTACPANYTMLSGSCHPGFNDQVTITNQFPNKSTNTWRCGFKNNTTTTRNVYVYTLCGR